MTIENSGTSAIDLNGGCTEITNLSIINPGGVACSMGNNIAETGEIASYAIDNLFIECHQFNYGVIMSNSNILMNNFFIEQNYSDNYSYTMRFTDCNVDTQNGTVISNGLNNCLFLNDTDSQ